MDAGLREQIGALFHQRWERSGLEGLLPEERAHVLLWELYAEVTSGGLDQYLCNSSGDHAQDVVEVLGRFGLARLAEVLRRTLAVLPDGWCADRTQRCRRVAAVVDRRNVLAALTEEFHDSLAAEPLSDNLAEAILAAYQCEGLLTETGAPPDPGQT